MPTITINSSFFVGRLNIPNKHLTEVSEVIDHLIKQHQDMCLMRLLGYGLSKQLKVETSQRMTDLVNGKEFTNSNGELRYWNGLIHKTNLSLIANFVWYKWQENEVNKVTGMGTMVPQDSNMKFVSPAERMIEVWNEFSDEAATLSSFLWNNKETYTEYKYTHHIEARRFSEKINLWGI